MVSKIFIVGLISLIHNAPGLIQFQLSKTTGTISASPSSANLKVP